MVEVATNFKRYPSKSSDKVYKARAFRPNEFPFCDCPAFIFGRSKLAKAEKIDQRLVLFVCKHLKDMYETTCQWKQTTPNEYRFDETCPKCGGSVVEEGTINYPKDPNTAIDDLLALRNELLGIDPPDPQEVVVHDLSALREELLKGINKI